MGVVTLSPLRSSFAVVEHNDMHSTEVPPPLFYFGPRWFNQNSDTPLGLTEEGCLFLGFASYKLALVIEVWESLKPRAKTREELDMMERPMLPELEDVDDIRPDLKDEKF